MDLEAQVVATPKDTLQVHVRDLLSDEERTLTELLHEFAEIVHAHEKTVLAN